MNKLKTTLLLMMCLLLAACSTTEPSTTDTTESEAVAAEAVSEEAVSEEAVSEEATTEEVAMEEEDHSDEEDHAEEEEHSDEEDHADEEEHSDEEDHADEEEHSDEEDHADEEEHDDHDDEEDHDDHDDEEDHDDHGDEEDHDDHDDEEDHDDHDDHDHSNEGGDLMLPELAAVALDGRQLRVVATTSIVGDVVSNIGGDQIELTVLMGAAVDPHSYETTPQDLVAMEDADVIFVNGWDLEERLAADIEENFSEKMVPISAGIEPIEFGGHSDDHDDEHGDDHDDEEHHDEEGEDHGDEEDHAEDEEHHDEEGEEHHDDEDEEHHDEEGEEHHDDEDEDHHDEEGEEHHDEHGEDDHHAHNHSGADPHVWFDIHNIERWSENVAEVLSEADPANTDGYQANLAAYIEQLEALEAEVDSMLASLPAENRKLVTNHDALGYFAEAYDFDVVGTVLPSLSTNADPSAGELAELIETMEEAAVCTVFGETTASNDLAETVVAELDACDTVEVLTIYTGALGEGDASSYIGMFRSNVQTIVDGLK